MKPLHFLLALSVLTAATATAQTGGYYLVKTIHIASPGGWDYPASDPGSNNLFVSHSSQVNIVDKTTGDSVGVIAGTAGVHGIAFANEFGKGYTSNGRTSNVTVFDLKTHAVLGQVGTGKNPDWIMYDAFSKKIITSDHSAGSLTVIDPATDKVVATIIVPGTLETIASDNAGKLFVNVEDKNEIVAVDIVKNTVLAHWSLGKAEGPTGLAIDTKTKRLFATCDKVMIVMDCTNGRIVSEVPIGDGCDGAAFDPATQTVFTSNGEGTMTVVKEVNANEFKVEQTVTTKKGARTITIDEKTHRLYLPTADYEPVPADAPKGTRAKMIPGSFQVLVYEK